MSVIGPYPPPPDSWIESPVTPGPPDLIPGLLPRTGHLLIAGETEVGKTLVALEIAQAILTGDPLWGYITPAATVGHVTYILGEHHEDTLRLLWRKMGLQAPSETLRLIGPQEHRVLTSRGELMKGNRDTYAAWCQGSGLVIFDPLNAFAAGIDVENDSTAMRACINAMGFVAHQAGAALLILAHMGKPHVDQKTGQTWQRGSYAARGSSAIEDAATCVFYMTRDEQVQDLYRLTRRKFKGDAPPFHVLKRDPLTLRQTYVLAQGCQ